MRKSGILLHIASLPNKYGIGTMGREAYKFVDWLRSAGQSLWQILPLSQTSFGDSPYQSFSAVRNTAKNSPHRMKVHAAPCHRPVSSQTMKMLRNHLALETRLPPSRMYT